MPRGWDPRKNRYSSPDSVSDGLSCLTCGNSNNPLGSKFCNRCGSLLSFSCSSCGNSNPPGSSFCNQCGSKLPGKSNTDIVKGTLRDSTNKPKSEDGLIKHDFVECIMRQNDAKINIPSNWTKMEYYDPNYPQQVIFKSPLENPQDPFYENLAVTYSQIPLGTTLDAIVQAEVDGLKRDTPGLVLIESLSTTLSGIPAQQLLWVEQGFKKLVIIAVRGDREYIIMYTAKPEKFDKFLPLVEQCISSFSFLG